MEKNGSQSTCRSPNSFDLFFLFSFFLVLARTWSFLSSATLSLRLGTKRRLTDKHSTAFFPCHASLNACPIGISVSPICDVSGGRPLSAFARGAAKSLLFSSTSFILFLSYFFSILVASFLLSSCSHLLLFFVFFFPSYLHFLVFLFLASFLYPLFHLLLPLFFLSPSAPYSSSSFYSENMIASFRLEQRKKSEESFFDDQMPRCRMIIMGASFYLSFSLGASLFLVVPPASIYRFLLFQFVSLSG